MRVCVVGGGASGMMVSAKIAKFGHDVSLYEKNEKLGKKLYITGKGRCNVTNDSSRENILKNIVVGEKFMIGAISSFGAKDTINFFEAQNVKLKVERGNRVFPESDKSSDIIKALERKLKTEKVNVLLNSKIEKISQNNDFTFDVLVDGEHNLFDSVVVATGGLSYPSTGSTGDGYKIAKQFGHTIINPVQALCPIILKDNDLAELEGLSLKNVKLKSFQNKKLFYESEVGEMLFTADGISGPLALTMSSYINKINPENLSLSIDFKPALSFENLLDRIDRDIISLKSKQVSSLIEGLLPKSLSKVFLKRLKIDEKFKANQLNKVDRQKIATMLKNFKLSFKNLADFNQAIITSGGISTKEINPKTMESKLVKNLYFVGEVLDVDALTGGFNLQIAFATANACAKNFINGGLD